ncbi:MAG: hypothetical protein SF182_13335 [Deltaproteobacteria bacterium]|nr:hypothetical protein [Deltaproteobacteria bacterium]
MLSFTISSALAAPRDAVWARVATMAGVNDELAPLARMTHPREAAAQSLEQVPLGQPAFRSWVLLFGVLPVEYDDLTMVQIEPGRGFREESPLLTQRLWIHERWLEDLPGGCRLTDRLTFEPRLALLGPLQQIVFRFFFGHRHRRLRRRFGRL